MADLGPTATPRLELMRSGDRPDDSGGQQKKKPDGHRAEAREKEKAPEIDFTNEDAHKLDERA